MINMTEILMQQIKYCLKHFPNDFVMRSLISICIFFFMLEIFPFIFPSVYKV